MEPLPRGANFQRAKMLWEIGLHIAGDPNTPYYGPRDMCISVGSGSNENFRPWLRMSTGSPILAHAVCRNELEMAMINPSGPAYSGVSWNRFISRAAAHQDHRGLSFARSFRLSHSSKNRLEVVGGDQREKVSAPAFDPGRRNAFHTRARRSDVWRHMA